MKMKEVNFTNYTLEQLTTACVNSLCWADVCRYLLISVDSRNTKKARALVEKHQIDISHFDINKTFGRNKTKANRTYTKKQPSYTIDELREAVNNSICWSDVCKQVNVTVCSFNYNRIRELCREHSITITHFDSKTAFKRGNKKIWTEEMLFVKDCDITRSSLRKVLIRLGFYTGTCAKCGINDEWNGEPLTIEIEHKNGDCRDNRKENLEWLCPNCHSQTPTYRRKNVIVRKE